MKRIVVTGATGFIGRHCLPLLLERGYEVHALFHRSQPVDADPEVHWHPVDLFQRKPVEDLIRAVKPDSMLHMAWHSDRGDYYQSADNFRSVQAGLDLMMAFRAGGGKRLLFAGSCAEYDWRYSYCIEDLTPLTSQTPYGVCKNALQQMVAAFCRKETLSAAWGRIFFVFGPHEHYTRLVPAVIAAILDGQPAFCTHGNQVRDYLYVKDVAAALVALLESDVTGPVNISSGRPIALKEIIFNIAHKLGRPDLIKLNALTPSPDEPAFLVGDTLRLRQSVGWRHQYDLEQGIEETIDWWSTHIQDR